MCWIAELLDVDVDSVDAEVAGQRYELADRPIAGVGGREEGVVLRGPGTTYRRARSARRGRGRRRGSDGRSGPVMPLCSRSRRSRGCRSCGGSRRKADRRQVGRGEVVGDRRVHLPVRHEAVDLVAGHGDRRGRAGGADPDCLMTGRRHPRRRGRRRDGSKVTARPMLTASKTGPRDDGASGHGEACRPSRAAVKWRRLRPSDPRQAVRRPRTS